VTGPVHYQIGLGNLANVVLVLQPELQIQANVSSLLFAPPARRNQMPTWVRGGEMDPSEPINNLIERELETLARQLQCRFYQPLRTKIGMWASG
jgi:hypothetical protein